MEGEYKVIRLNYEKIDASKNLAQYIQDCICDSTPIEEDINPVKRKSDDEYNAPKRAHEEEREASDPLKRYSDDTEGNNAKRGHVEEKDDAIDSVKYMKKLENNSPQPLDADNPESVMNILGNPDHVLY